MYQNIHNETKSKFDQAGSFESNLNVNLRHPRTRNGFGNRMFADQNFNCPHVSKHRGNHHKVKEEQTPKPALGSSASIGSSTIDSGRPRVKIWAPIRSTPWGGFLGDTLGNSWVRPQKNESTAVWGLYAGIIKMKFSVGRRRHNE